MKAFLATVLSVIAVGVLLIAYGLLAPRASAASQVRLRPANRDVPARATGARDGRVALPDSRGLWVSGRPGRLQHTGAVHRAASRPAVYTQPAVYDEPQAPEVRTAPAAAAPQRSVARVEEKSGRNWKKTALVIGGSTATGAGVGALVGGKKGALIGAAIGGGASTLYEVRK